MGSLGATSPRRPPSHHELQSDPYKMRVFLAVLLLASAKADKPAVAPAYTGAATVDETFGSALKRDAPAAAAPDSYGSQLLLLLKILTDPLQLRLLSSRTLTAPLQLLR